MPDSVPDADRDDDGHGHGHDDAYADGIADPEPRSVSVRAAGPESERGPPNDFDAITRVSRHVDPQPNGHHRRDADFQDPDDSDCAKGGDSGDDGGPDPTTDADRPRRRHAQPHVGSEPGALARGDTGDPARHADSVGRRGDAGGDDPPDRSADPRADGAADARARASDDRADADPRRDFDPDAGSATARRKNSSRAGAPADGGSDAESRAQADEKTDFESQTASDGGALRHEAAAVERRLRRTDGARVDVRLFGSRIGGVMKARSIYPWILLLVSVPILDARSDDASHGGGEADIFFRRRRPVAVQVPAARPTAEPRSTPAPKPSTRPDWKMIGEFYDFKKGSYDCRRFYDWAAKFREKLAELKRRLAELSNGKAPTSSLKLSCRDGGPKNLQLGLFDDNRPLGSAYLYAIRNGEETSHQALFRNPRDSVPEWLANRPASNERDDLDDDE